MNTKIILTAAVLLVGGSFALEAQQNMNASQNNYSSSSWFNSSADDLYRVNELSVDAFAAVSGDGRDHGDYYGDYHHHDARGGGGGGLEFFFCRYIGIEAESFALANNHDTTSAVGGNLALRLPIGETGFSPYVFGGGGHEWDYRSEAYGDGGVGLEYRFTRSIGIFGDGRFVSPGSTRDYGMGRFGVRFAF